MRRSDIPSFLLLNQSQSSREKCYIKIDPKYPDRWNESLKCRALDRGKGKLFKRAILYVYKIFLFSYSQGLDRLGDWKGGVALLY